jgi:hypothetical protein
MLVSLADDRRQESGKLFKLLVLPHRVGRARAWSIITVNVGSLQDRPVSILFEGRKLEEFAYSGTNARTICVRAT